MSDRRYILWGSSGHAKVLTALIEGCGDRVEVVFDNDPAVSRVVPHADLYFGRKGFHEWLDKVAPGDYVGIAAIGGHRGQDRIEIHTMFETAGIRVESLLHESAWICPTAEIGRGTQILAHATVGAQVKLGVACILNHAATVDHECSLDDGVHVAPGATLCGCIKIGQNSFIGAGAVVLPRVSIGSNSIVGAGAVVTRDVPSNAIVVGNPAKLTRYRTSADKLEL